MKCKLDEICLHFQETDDGPYKEVDTASFQATDVDNSGTQAVNDRLASKPGTSAGETFDQLCDQPVVPSSFTWFCSGYGITDLVNLLQKM